METKTESKMDLGKPQFFTKKAPEATLIFINKQAIESLNNVSDKGEEEVKLPGVLYKGVQYYDLKNASFINSTGLASLICLSKSLIKKGITLKFVNVNPKVKEKINSMGLNKFINCN